jgi:hypothetical protein
MSRRATSGPRHQRTSATASLAVRSGAPAAAVAAVSSLTLTGVAVLGFMPSGSTLGLGSPAEGLRAPGVVEAIPFTTPTTSTSTRATSPGTGFTVTSGTGRLLGPSGTGDTVRRPSSPARSSAPVPAAPTTSRPGRAPVYPPPLIIAVGGLPDRLASSARQVVVDAVNSSLSAVMKPRQLQSVQDTLTPAVDLAVRSAVSSAATDALNAATAATAENASLAEVNTLTTDVFRSSLTPALAATVPVAVSTTLATAGVVTSESATVVDALVTVAASEASSDVADVATSTVVDQVTTVVTTPGATPTTPDLTPSPTTTNTTSSAEEPTGTPDTPDADATGATGTSTVATTSASTSTVLTGPTSVPAPGSLPASVASVETSHALVTSLATPAPMALGVSRAWADFYRVTPHLLVRITTTAQPSPGSAPASGRTTTTLVPTVTTPPVRSDRASTRGQQARAGHVTHEQKAPVAIASNRATSSPRTSTSPRSTTSSRLIGSPTTASGSSVSRLPDGFTAWNAHKQWRWLRASGQNLTFQQWKAAIRQARSSVDAGLIVTSR